MAVGTAKAMTVSGDLAAYDVRTCTKRVTSDNKAFVSSLTGGKTHREPGNLDAGWDISLYAPVGVTEVPVALMPGATISVELEHDNQAYDMIVDDATLEVDIESAEIVGISLTCSAIDAGSYA